MSERTYSHVRLTLPTFALDILRERAKRRRQRLSAAVEGAILESIMVDEVEAMAHRSPHLGRVFAEWFGNTVRKK
jgi:hypothetical protein